MTNLQNINKLLNTYTVLNRNLILLNIGFYKIGSKSIDIDVVHSLIKELETTLTYYMRDNNIEVLNLSLCGVESNSYINPIFAIPDNDLELISSTLTYIAILKFRLKYTHNSLKKEDTDAYGRGLPDYKLLSLLKNHYDKLQSLILPTYNTPV